jgi:sulfotransferase family protein
LGGDYGIEGRLRLVPVRLRAACFLDLGRGIRDTTLVVSTGRSGSTWVAELVNHRNEYRLVFEPFRPERVRKARALGRGYYIDPSDQTHPQAAKIDSLLAGRVRGWWTDHQNHRRIARRRIVKDVRITNLLPWIRVRHPALRIVYVVRDPVAVARSWIELGWDDDLEALLTQDQLLARFADVRGVIDSIAAGGDPLERNVVRWCLENAIPLREAGDLDIHLVIYEHLRDHPEVELERLFTYLGMAAPATESVARKPSETADFPRLRPVTFGDAERARARELVGLFGLHALAPVDAR